MKCPLCNKELIELNADEEEYGDETEYICTQRIVAGTRENIPYTVSHFEWRAGHSYYLVQVPPYRLHVFNDGTNVYQDPGGLGQNYKEMMSLKSITKDNLSTFGKNYNELANRIKKLVLFS